jgi:hypothetical protein
MGVRKIVCEDMNLFELTQDRVQMATLVVMIMDIYFP